MKLVKNYVEPEEAYDVVSVAVFESKAGMASGAKRARLLEQLVDAVEESLPTFVVRVHYDDSVRVTGSAWATVLRALSKRENVQMVRYDVPEMKKTGGYHDVAFNSIARFLPWFDVESLARIMVAVDIDATVSQISYKSVMVIRQFSLSRSQFHFKTKACLHTSAKHRQMSEKGGRTAFWRKATAPLAISRVKLQRDQYTGLQELLTEQRGAQHVDEYFLNNIAIAHIDTAGLAYSYTLEDDMFRIIQDADPQDGEFATAVFNRILDKSLSNPQKKLATVLKMADAPDYDQVVDRLVHECAIMFKDKTFQKAGFDKIGVQCILRHGRSRTTAFILDKRKTMTFDEELAAECPTAKVSKIPKNMMSHVEALMANPVCDGAMTLDRLMRKLSSGCKDKLVIKGGLVRDLVRGEVDFKDIDLAIHNVSVYEATRRLKRDYGNALPVQETHSIALVMIGSDPESAIDVTDMDLTACSWDSTCNSLMLDPFDGTIIDPTGMGLADARDKVYRFSCPDPDLYMQARGVPALWRALKFALRDWTFIESELVHLLDWIYHKSDDSADIAWTTLPFKSNIRAGEAEPALKFLKDRVDDYHSRDLLDFDGGDMLMHLLKRETIVANPRASQSSQKPRSEAKKSPPESKKHEQPRARHQKQDGHGKRRRGRKQQK